MNHTHPADIRVATFNVSGLAFPPFLKLRMQAIAEYFNASDIDVLLLQEVHSRSSLRIFKRYLTAFPHGAYTHSFFGPAAGLVIFSRLPLTKPQFYRVTRGSQKGILVSSIDGIGTIANVHLSADKDGVWTHESRYYKKQRAQLNDVISVVQRIHGPFVIGGDFNVASMSELYQHFVTGSHLQDTTQGVGEPTFHGEFLPKHRIPQRIDYIFMRGFQTTGTQRHFAEKSLLHNGANAYVSSHCALSATLRAS